MVESRIIIVLCYYLLIVGSLVIVVVGGEQPQQLQQRLPPQHPVPGSTTVTTTTFSISRKKQGIPRNDIDSVSAFLSDLENLKAWNGEVRLLTPTHSRRDSSYTKSWSNEDWKAHQVRSFRRYVRHLSSWPKSPTALAVLPTVASLIVWTLVVYYLAHHVQWITNFLALTSSSLLFSTGISSFAAPISLLLALRTNRALDRLLEARTTCGVMVRVAGTFASLSAIYICPIDKEKGLLMGRYMSLFGWTVKGLLLGEDDTKVLQAMLRKQEVEWLEQMSLLSSSKGNIIDTPTLILFRLRELLASVIQDLPSWTVANAMESCMEELERVLGVCKRLLGSPIPPTYTRHTSRVLCLYLGLLPISLVASKVALIGIIINIALLSYVFVGIDEIGVEIEHPFPLLPMYYLCLATQKTVANHFLMMDHNNNNNNNKLSSSLSTSSS